MPKPRPILNRVCIAWLLFCPLWMIWGAATYGGLYRWLCEWQLSANGEYDAFLTFTVPVVLLAMPAALLPRLQFDRKSSVPPTTLGPEAAERLVVRFLCVVGVTGAIVCAGAWLWARHYPDRAGPSVPVDLATLGDGIPPLGRVTLLGAIDGAHVVRKTTDAKGAGGRSLYAPMIVPGAAQPLTRIFVDEYTDGAMTRPLPTDGEKRVRGVLVEGGLPGDTRRQFARLGIIVADPYYLLLTGPDGARGTFYVVAGFGGFAGLIGLLPLAAVLLTKAWRHRRAT